MHPSIRRPKNEQVEVELGVKIAAKLRAFLNVTFIYEGMRAPNDVSMSGLLVAVEKPDDGRGGVHTDSKGVQLVTVCYVTVSGVDTI